MFSLAIEPATRGDEQEIGTALDKLCDEDPCFKVGHDQQTNELIINGLGDLHLRVMLEKMEKRFSLSVSILRKWPFARLAKVHLLTPSPRQSQSCLSR